MIFSGTWSVCFEFALYIKHFPLRENGELFESQNILRFYKKQQVPICYPTSQSPLIIYNSEKIFIHSGLAVDSLKFMNKK